MAEGLQYLHAPDGDLLPMVHRDMKSANVLLDAENRARISDVGLARPAAQHGTTMTHGVGTFGYVDPEYLETGDYTPGSDVFSMGVVFLELFTGATANDRAQKPPNLHARMRQRLPEETEAVKDPAAKWDVLGDGVVAWEFAAVALHCIETTAARRPSLAQVLFAGSLMLS